jgi:pimeloyl-ACP methyl ester carboxylesterase
MLTGALGQADFGFAAVERLGREFKVVAPDYPPVASLDELVAGLCAVLDAEGIARAHLLGGSFGGLAAQTLAFERPDRVASVVLSHTGPPRRAPGAGVAVALLSAFPGRLLKSLFRRRVRSAVEVAGPFWIAEFEAAVARLTKADIVSRTRLAAEFGRRYGAVPPTGDDSRKVMILDSADDPLISARDRSRLRGLYPRAAVHEFEGMGHLAAVLRPEAFADAVVGFLHSAEGTRAS